TEIYSLSLHDALPISGRSGRDGGVVLSPCVTSSRWLPSRPPPGPSLRPRGGAATHPGLRGRVQELPGGSAGAPRDVADHRARRRSEEHTSELQSLTNL